MRFIFIFLTMIFFNGCSLIENIDEKASKNIAKKEFINLCNREDLLICGSSAKTINLGEYFDIKYEYSEYIDQNDLRPIFSIFSYVLENLVGEYYQYKEDTQKNESYNYMFPDENGQRHGDCEDFVITLLEDNIENGNIQKGEAKWIFGKVNGDYHSWAIIKKNNKEFIFDTYYRIGEKLNVAYNENNYKQLLVLFSY
jgi:hypothetical protein